jgi:hypothetical protein
LARWSDPRPSAARTARALTPAIRAAGQCPRADRVGSTGAIHFEGDHVRIGVALTEKLVGLRFEGGLRWRVYFFEVDLGTIEVASLNGVVSTERVNTVNGSVNLKKAADEGRL